MSSLRACRQAARNCASEKPAASSARASSFRSARVRSRGRWVTICRAAELVRVAGDEGGERGQIILRPLALAIARGGGSVPVRVVGDHQRQRPAAVGVPVEDRAERRAGADPLRQFVERRRRDALQTLLRRLAGGRGEPLRRLAAEPA